MTRAETTPKRRAKRLDADPDPDVSMDADHHMVIEGVSWEQYEAVREALDEKSSLRMTYLEGRLELVSPGKRHETAKKLIARLVELYALERDIVLEGAGNMTFKKKVLKRGLEPDECWCLAEVRDDRPDIAFEVVVTGAAIKRLDVYRGLEVPEVRLWENDELTVFKLGKKGYDRRARSAFMPGLDMELVSKLVNESRTQTETVRAFREILRRVRR